MLFVCTANVTRSPAAAAFFEALAIKSGEHWVVSSAGVKALKGGSPNNVVKYAISRQKLDISKHRSQPVTKKLLASFRWILVMEAKHRDAIITLDPDAGRKTFCLRNFAVSDPTIPTDFPDPTGKDIQDFDELFKLLNEAVPRAFNALRDRVISYEMGSESDD